jgi:S-DNA-T family DNA segregation ATPase FtsK/SpoIIIE
MLYSANGSADLVRIQGAFVSGEEVSKIVDFIKENNECEFDSDIEDEMFNSDQGGFKADGGSTQEFDPLMKESLRLFIKQQSASISKLQRFFSIGFPRAAKIVDQMELAGFVGPKDSKNLRPLYITQQEFEERFGEDL